MDVPAFACANLLKFYRFPYIGKVPSQFTGVNFFFSRYNHGFVDSGYAGKHKDFPEFLYAIIFDFTLCSNKLSCTTTMLDTIICSMCIHIHKQYTNRITIRILLNLHTLSNDFRA